MGIITVRLLSIVAVKVFLLLLVTYQCRADENTRTQDFLNNFFIKYGNSTDDKQTVSTQFTTVNPSIKKYDDVITRNSTDSAPRLADSAASTDSSTESSTVSSTPDPNPSSTTTTTTETTSPASTTPEPSSTTSTTPEPSSTTSTTTEPTSTTPTTATQTTSTTPTTTTERTTPTPTTTTQTTSITPTTTTQITSTTPTTTIETTSTTPTRTTEPTTTTPTTTQSTTLTPPITTASSSAETSTIISPTKNCPDETDDHLTFPKTEAGTWTTPTQLCLDDNYNPIIRYCFPNGTWDSTEEGIICSKQITDTTNALYNAMSEPDVTTAIDAANEISRQNQSEFRAVDVYFVAKILKNASQNDTFNSTDNFVGIINNIMGVSRNELTLSQHRLNSTDTILYSLDHLLLTFDNLRLTVPNLLVYTISTTETIGAMIKAHGQNNDFTSFDVISLNEENYLDQLNTTNFEVAFIIPQSFTKNHDYYFITLFQSDSLFNQENAIAAVGSWIISILIPDVANGNSTIKIYFKEIQKNLDRPCQHWRYGKNENDLPIKGRWSRDGNAKKFKDGFYMCEVNHTTHFGMLVSNTVPDNFVLDLITIFGTILSLIGISIILVTGLIFKRWRNKANNKIILNVSVCLLLLIILFFVSDAVSEGNICIIVGILLHYMILAQTCWTLTISFSSYRRFHLVCNDHISHVVLKFCAFSWGVPLIVVIITAAINVHTYDKTSDAKSSQICYPKGPYLNLGVCLPMAIILVINSIVYVLIVKKLLLTKLDIRKTVTKKSCSLQKSIILLFFMMGLTWIFGLLLVFTGQEVFVYLFCTTATCHGFAIFIFYILDSTEVKQLWKNQISTVMKKASRKSKSTELENNTSEFVT